VVIIKSENIIDLSPLLFCGWCRVAAYSRQLYAQRPL